MSLRMNNSNDSVLSAALKILSRRRMTVSVLKKKLREKGFLSEEIDHAVDRLVEWKYLDDFSYAQDFIRSKRNRVSRRKVLYELLKVGIDKQLAEELMERHYDEESEYASCLEIAQKMWIQEEKKIQKKINSDSRYKDFPPELLIKKKIGDKLMAKGYCLNNINSVLNQLTTRK